MSENSAAAAAPDVRLSQLSHSEVGDVADSINLFRGDVNLPLPLVMLRGRNGLDTSLTAFYASNVHTGVQLANRTAPTGILGVGWSLPYEQVVLDAEAGGAGHGDFYLVTGGAPRRLLRSGTEDGAEVFELADHQFWTVRHYRDDSAPADDRWEVVRENGSTYVYGLAGIEWGVRWGNWTGPSTSPGGQRYPVAWNLVRVTSAQGDQLMFEYEQEQVPIGGPAGPSFTRACYLSRITDSFGQTVDLRYGEKEPFEVEAAHPVPPGGAHAFQDRLQTRYLDRIDVATERGDELFHIQLGYDFLDVSDAGQHAETDYRKRYLTTVTEVTRTGAALPPLELAYHDDRDAQNPGALRTLRYPKGAVVSYEYAAEPLRNASVHRSVPTPGPGFAPRVWHGPGYVVVTWHNPTIGELSLQVYSWDGTWNAWTDTRMWSIAEDSLQVQPGQGCYVVSFRDARTGEHRIRLFRQDVHRYGEWSQTPYQVDLPAGESAPLVRLGPDFVAIADQVSGRLLIVEWDLAAASWIEYAFSVPGTDQVALACAPDACVLGGYDTPARTLRLALHHRAPDGRWIRSDVLDEPVDIDWELTAPAALLGAGANFAAASFVSGVDSDRGEVDYGVRLVTWSTDFHFGQVFRHDTAQPLDLANPIGAVGIDGSTVANAQHVFRFDGQTWQAANLLQPHSGSRYAYGYGSDVAVGAVMTTDGDVTYRRVSYDPYAGSWLPPVAAHPRVRRPHTRSADLVSPAVSGDVLVAGREVFRRTPRLTWEPVFTLPSAADLASVANRAPAYLAWQDAHPADGDSPTSYVMALTADGRVRAAHPLPGERMSVPGAGPGRLLAGPDVCVTFRGASLDGASSLHLYRIVDGQIGDELTDRAVCRATTDDGYGEVPVTIEYDRETATYDPYAKVAQYVRARLYRGGDAESAGYVESVFFNGLRPEAPGVVYPPTSEFTNARQFFAKLSGQLYQQVAVDAAGRPVRRVRNDLYTYDRTNSEYSCLGSFTRRRRTEIAESLLLFTTGTEFAGPLDHRQLPAGLRAQLATAGFPLADPVTVTVAAAGRRWSIADAAGVELPVVLDEGELRVFGWLAESTTFGYNAMGQLASATATNVDSEGKEVELRVLTTFGWQVYPQLAARHILDLAAEVRTVDASTAEVIDRAVTTYRAEWPAASGVWTWHKTYQWNGDPAAGDFDFAAWSGDAEPDRGWVRTAAVLDVTARGLPRSTVDIDDNVGGVVYDQAGRFPVAVVALADPAAGEAGWYGFEEYEDDGGWRLTPDGADRETYITRGDAFAGSRRLAIPGDPSRPVGLVNTFTPAAEPYLLSCWVKTEPGFVADPELAGWRVSVGTAEPVVTPVPDTAGRWQHFHLLVTGIQAGDTVTAEIFSRQDHRWLLVDAISFAPLHGQCRATVYDPVDKLPVATVDHTGSVFRFGYDQLRRPVLTVRDTTPTDLAVEYLWRAHQGQAGFDPADPNATLTAVARTGGVYTDFRHGDEWSRWWDASTGWQLRDDALHYEGSADPPGTVRLREADYDAGYVTRVLLTAAPGATGPVGFAFGEVFTADWVDGRWELRDSAGTLLESTEQPHFDHHDLTLVVAGRAALVTADGRTVLRHVFPDQPTGAVSFRTAGPVALHWLTVCGDPVVGATYADNAGQVRQVQSLDDGQVRVSAWCYDGQGRPEVATKAAALAGPLGYRTDFTAALDPDTGAMGDCALTRAYPADEGYPFDRIRFDRSPLGRPVEQGAPGRALAIDSAVAPGQRHTTRMEYRLNLADPAFGLPAGQYRSTVVIDPDGTPAVQLTDRRGAIVATRAGGGEGEARSQMRYDARGNLIELRQPNFFDESVPHRVEFVSTMQYDFNGNVVWLRTPDLAGPARSVHDRAGRLRFQAMPEQTAHDELTYRRYDRLGRLVEQGVCESPWRPDELTAHADDRDWLPGPARWRLRYQYDGDGRDLRLLGRLWRADVGGDDNTPATTKTFRYDRSGQVTTAAQTVAGFDGQTRAVRYSYNLAGAATAVRYPADGGDVRVRYRYDQLNQLAGVALVGPDGARREVAAYTYLPGGQVDMETLSPGSEEELVRTYRYTPSGWLSEVADAHLVERAEYFTGGFAGAGSFTGRAMRVESRISGVPDPQFMAEHRYEYAYDALGRLRTARAVPDGGFSLGDQQPLRYDANGNLLELQQGDQQRRFDYYPGSNRLRGEVATRRPSRRDPVAGEQFEFDADGGLIEAAGLGLSEVDYEPVSGRVVRIDVGRVTTVDLEYDPAGARVLKSGPNGRRLYLTGQDGDPVLVHEADGPPAHLIYGPLGLLAVHRDGDLHHLLRGRLGSTRVVRTGGTVVAAYNYQPFGTLLGAAYRPTGFEVPYLFAGQELDAETGLYNMGARCYDPRTGRMISVDPAGQYPSPYLYAGADPINLFDPTGEFSWSWGAFTAVASGVLMLAGGVVATILTAGAATPLMVLGALGGGLLIGAGLAGAAYGFLHADADTRTFDWAQWGVTVGLGAGFGLLAAAGGLAAAPLAGSLGALGLLGVEAVLGGVLGMADSLANTVALNSLAGNELLSGWQTALWAGAAAGSLGGAIGGTLGRGAALRTNLTVRAGRAGPGGRMYVLDQDIGPKYHTVVGGFPNTPQEWATQLSRGVLNNVPNRAVIGPTGRTLNNLLGLANWGRVRMGAEIDVPAQTVANVGAWAQAAVGGRGQYSTLFNGCTTWGREVLQQAGLVPPVWAISPRSLAWWAGVVGTRIR